MTLTDQSIVVTGGTGSLGQVLVRRLLSGELGMPGEVIVFSRDEAKQHAMRLAFEHRLAATDDIVFEGAHHRLRFEIGDVADYAAVSRVLRSADVVCHAAALKQVPTCELNPYEAIKTNVLGAENLVRAIRDLRLPVKTVVGVATDKACKPVNVMGMTKALQERVLAQANLECPGTRFVLARYGNVLASRGSVIPLFHAQISAGGPLTITTRDMTRFLLSLDRAVDTLFAALTDALPGETYVPQAPAGRIVDLASALIGSRNIEIREVGIRPGEKIHEVLVSEEEATRTVERGDFFAISPILPQLRMRGAAGRDGHIGEFSSADVVMKPDKMEEFLREDAFSTAGEYSSADGILSPAEVGHLLSSHGLMVEDAPVFS
jgi:FlaA1/EpsC-like NDP-sugar epimerase